MSGRGTLISLALSLVLATLVALPAFAADTTFFAILKGGHEVSGAGQANAGDPDGYGAASLVFRSNTRLCYSIIVWNIDAPTVAHLHRGPAGVNGPIVIPLTAPAAGSPGDISDCIVIDAELGSAIRSVPSGYYVNVHTGDFAGGAVRGQLF